MIARILLIWISLFALGRGSAQQDAVLPSMKAEQSYVISEYGVSEGLNTTDLNCITQDSDGFIWVGHSLGLSKFDGLRFINYTNLDSLKLGNVIDLQLGKGNDLLVGTDKGLFLRSRIDAKLKNHFLDEHEIYDIKQKRNTIWVSTNIGIYTSQYSQESIIDSFVQVVSVNDIDEIENKIEFLSIEVDHDHDRFWFGTYHSLYLYEQGVITKLWSHSVGCYVWSIKKGPDNILFSTKYFGAFKHADGVTTPLFINTVYTRDFSESELGWQIIQDDTLYTFSNSKNTINSKISLDAHSQKFLITSLEDRQGNYWVCTKEGLIMVSKAKFETSSVVSDYEVYSVYTDDRHKLFGANHGQIYALIDPLRQDGLELVCQLPTKAEIFDIINFNDLFYLATGYGGVFVLDQEYQIIKHITDLVAPSIYNLKVIDDQIYAIGDLGYTIINDTSSIAKVQVSSNTSVIRFNDLILHQDKVILSSKNGLYTKIGNTLTALTTGNELIGNSAFTSIATYHDNQLYISTLNRGILSCEFNSHGLTVKKTIDKNSGLRSNNVLKVKIINNHLIAICYDGISVFNLNNGTAKWHSQLSKSNGFEFSNFKNCDLSEVNDTTWFASTKGIGHFQITNFDDSEFNTPTLTRLSYSIGEEELEFKDIYDKNISIPTLADQVVIEYSFPDLTNSKDKLTQSRLTNLDHTWTTPTSDGTRYLGKINPGKYLLQIRDLSSGRSSDALWIIIPPPWYRTWYAYLLWISGLALSLVLLFRFQLSRNIAQQETQRLKEVDQMKTSFFNQISHDFRTPLAVIKNELGNIEENYTSKAVIQRNSDHLLYMVEQVLDVGKLNSNNYKPTRVCSNISEFVRQVAHPFVKICKSQNRYFQIDIKDKELIVEYDPLIFQRVLYNLLDNAVKYSAPHDTIKVTLDSEDNPKKGWFLEVLDTGSGIPIHQQKEIFQLYKHNSQNGYGIGLYIVSEYVKIQGGRIELNSTPGMGSSFKLIFPIRNIKTQDKK